MASSISERNLEISKLNYSLSKEDWVTSFEAQSSTPWREVVEEGTLEHATRTYDNLSFKNATHFVHVPYDRNEEVNITNGVFSEEDLLFENLNSCVPVFSRPSTNDNNFLGKINCFHTIVGRLGGLTRKVGSFVVVLEESIGGGEFDKIKVLNHGGDLDGTECFIKRNYIHRLAFTKKSLPVNNLTCKVISDVDGTICDAITPQWANLSTPYYYGPKCEYWVTVKTSYGDTGGVLLESRKKEAISEAIDRILEYFDKIRDDDTKRILKEESYLFAEAVTWHLDEPPGGRLKILVSFPVKYIDAIPRQTKNLNDYLDEKIPNWYTSISFKTNEMAKDMSAVANLMTEFATNSQVQNLNISGPIGYGQFLFRKEAERFMSFLPLIMSFVKTNGLVFRTNNSDNIEIGFDREFRILYVLYDRGLGNTPLTVGINELINSEPCVLRRTMGILAATHDIKRFISRDRNRLSYKTFIDEYVMPLPEIEELTSQGGKTPPCRPDPLNPMKCCEFDLLESTGVADHFDSIGKNTLSRLRANNFTDPKKLAKEFYNYQKSHISPICGGDRDALDLFKSSKTSLKGLWEAAKCATGDPDGNVDYNKVAECSNVAYDEKGSPIKTDRVKLFEDRDIEKISPGLFGCIKTQYDFIEDPFLKSLVERLLGKGPSVAGGDSKYFSAEEYNPPTLEDVSEYMSNIDFFSIVEKAVDCACSLLDNIGDRAVAQAGEIDEIISQTVDQQGEVPTTSDWWFSKRPNINRLKKGEKLQSDAPSSLVREYIRKNDGQAARIPRNSLLGSVALSDSRNQTLFGEIDNRGELVLSVDTGGLGSGKPLAQPLLANSVNAGMDVVSGITPLDLTNPVHAQFAHALVCQDICNTLPVLCSCIDLTLPPIDLPEFSFSGIFGYLFDLLIDILVDMLINILLGIIYKIIEDMLRCEFKEADPQVQEDFNNALQGAAGFRNLIDDNFAEDINDEINTSGLQADVLKPFLDDVPLVVSPTEFCMLLRGEPPNYTLNTLEDLMDSQHPGLRAYIRGEEQLRELFIAIGRRMGDLSICSRLIDLSQNTRNTTIADHICEDVNLDQVRETLRAGNTTPEQVSELLNRVRLCRQQRTLAIADMTRELSENPTDFFDKLIPPVYGAPGEDSLVPRDPPELLNILDKVGHTFFEQVKVKFDQDASSFPSNLIEYKYDGITIDSDTSTIIQTTQDVINSGDTQASMFNYLKNITGGDTTDPVFQNSFGNFTSIGAPTSKEVGFGLQSDLMTQDNFKFNMSEIKDKTATAFTMYMSPFKSYGYKNVVLDFRESDNPIDYLPGAWGVPNNDENLITAMGIVPVNTTVKLNYRLPLSSFCHDWDRERDFYEVEIYNRETTTNLRGEEFVKFDGPRMILVGEKRIEDEYRSSIANLGYTNALGKASLQQEIFATWTTNIWNEYMGSLDEPDTTEINISDPDGPLFNHYMTNSFNLITEEILQSMAETTANSKLFDVENLEKLQLKGDTACFPPRDSLIAIDKIISNYKSNYRNNKVVNRHQERFGLALIEATIYTAVRTYVLEFVLGGIFAFSRFNVNDIIDDTFIRLCVNHIRDSLLREGPFPLDGKILGYEELRLFLRESGIATTEIIDDLKTWKDSYYEEFIRWVQIVMMERIGSGESFFNPFTRKEIAVTFSAIAKQDRISVGFDNLILPISDYYLALQDWLNTWNEYSIVLAQNENDPNFFDSPERRREYSLFGKEMALYGYEREIGVLDHWWSFSHNSPNDNVYDWSILEQSIQQDHENPSEGGLLDLALVRIERQNIYEILTFFIKFVSGLPNNTINLFNNLSDSNLDWRDQMNMNYPDSTSRSKNYHQIVRYLGRIIPSSFKLILRFVNEVTRTSNCECIPIRSEEAYEGQISDGSATLDGKTKVGYLEYLVLEQLYSVKDDIESYLGTEIEDINSLMLGSYDPNFSSYNELAEDIKQKYFIKEVTDVPSYSQNGDVGRIPSEVLNGTSLPFVIERYVKIIDYSAQFWQGLLSDSQNGLNSLSPQIAGYSLDKRRELFDKFAPQNRSLISQESINFGDSSLGAVNLDSLSTEIGEIDLTPVEGDRETIVPINKWFEWLYSHSHHFANSQTLLPLWNENEEGEYDLDFKSLFFDIKFGLRIVYIDKLGMRNTNQNNLDHLDYAYEHGGVSSVKDAAVELLNSLNMGSGESLDNSTNSSFETLQHLSRESILEITKRNKAFFLSETTFSMYDPGEQGGHIKVAYPSGKEDFLSLPLLQEEISILPGDISVNPNGGNNGANILFTNSPWSEQYIPSELPYFAFDRGEVGSNVNWGHWSNRDAITQDTPARYVNSPIANPPEPTIYDPQFAKVFGIIDEIANHTFDSSPRVNLDSICTDDYRSVLETEASSYYLYAGINNLLYQIRATDISKNRSLLVTLGSDLENAFTVAEEENLFSLYNLLFMWRDYSNRLKLIIEGQDDASDADILRLENTVESCYLKIKNIIEFVKDHITENFNISLNWSVPEDGILYPYVNFSYFVGEMMDSTDIMQYLFSSDSLYELEEIANPILQTSSLVNFVASTEFVASMQTNIPLLRILGDRSNLHCAPIIRETIQKSANWAGHGHGNSRYLNSTDRNLISNWWSFTRPDGAYYTELTTLRDSKLNILDLLPNYRSAEERIEAQLRVSDLEAEIERLHNKYWIYSANICFYVNSALRDMYFEKEKRAYYSIDRVFKSLDTSISNLSQLPQVHKDTMNLFDRLYYPQLTTRLKKNSDFKLLTGYLFPLKRYTSLMGLYTQIKIAGLISHKQPFSETKLTVKQLFATLLTSNVSDENGRPGWHRVDVFDLLMNGAFGPLPWWIKILKKDLSFNLSALLTMVPRKLLQLILSVPFFSTIVDPLCSVMSGWPFLNDWTTCKELLGNLPPNKQLPEPSPVGATQIFCGEPLDRARSKKNHEEKMKLSKPESLMPKDKVDLPFYG